MILVVLPKSQALKWRRFRGDHLWWKSKQANSLHFKKVSKPCMNKAILNMTEMMHILFLKMEIYVPSSVLPTVEFCGVVFESLLFHKMLLGKRYWLCSVHLIFLFPFCLDCTVCSGNFCWKIWPNNRRFIQKGKITLFLFLSSLIELASF